MCKEKNVEKAPDAAGELSLAGVVSTAGNVATGVAFSTAAASAADGSSDANADAVTGAAGVVADATGIMRDIGAATATGTDATDPDGVATSTAEFGGVPYAAHAVHGVGRHRAHGPRTLRADWPGADRAWVEDPSPASQRVFSAVYYSDLVD